MWKLRGHDVSVMNLNRTLIAGAQWRAFKFQSIFLFLAGSKVKTTTQCSQNALASFIPPFCLDTTAGGRNNLCCSSAQLLSSHSHTLLHFLHPLPGAFCYTEEQRSPEPALLELLGQRADAEVSPHTGRQSSDSGVQI